MLTSSLADKLVILKIKIIMNSMNEIVNPPCNSLLGTFFGFNFEKCQKKASSCPKTSVHRKRTLRHSFELLFPLSLLLPLKRKLVEREARSVRCDGQRDQLKKAMFARRRLVRRQKWRTRTLMLLVAFGVDEVVVSGCKFEGFTLSEILRLARIAKKNVSEGVVDTVHIPQCEFAIIHHLPLTFLQKFFAGRSMNSVGLVVLRALKHEDDFVRLLCFSVSLLWTTGGSFR